jgi:cutinase
VEDTLKRLNQQATQCPKEKFAIVGYSQGAAVMHSAAAKISPAIQQRIVAVVMYGDPGRTRQKFPATLQSRLFENCAKGDFVSHIQ